jgi:hypothetical protein
MSYDIQILFGKNEISKYHLDIALTIAEKEINLKKYSFDYKIEMNAFLKGLNEAVGWTEYFLIERSESGEETSVSLATRKDFMEFFRNDDLLTLLTVDDRIEIFSSILLGDGDFTKELLDQILSDYGVNHLVIIDSNAKRQL